MIPPSRVLLRRSRPESKVWLTNYDENRPHDGLGGLPPAHFLPRVAELEESSLRVCA